MVHNIAPDALKAFFESSKAEEMGRTKEAVETVKAAVLGIETRINQLEIKQADISVYIRILFSMLAGLSGWIFKDVIVKMIGGA